MNYIPLPGHEVRIKDSGPFEVDEINGDTAVLVKPDGDTFETKVSDLTLYSDYEGPTPINTLVGRSAVYAAIIFVAGMIVGSMLSASYAAELMGAK